MKERLLQRHICFSYTKRDKQHKVYDQFNAEGTPQWLLITNRGELYRSIFGSQEGAQNRLSYAIETLVENSTV